MTVRALTAFVLLAAAAACGSDSSTAPTPIFTTSSQFVVSALTPGGDSLYTFSTSSQSIIHVTFASLVSATSGEPIDGSITLGLGTPSGATCSLTTTQPVTPALAAQIRSSQPAGTYCIRVADAGGLGEAATFTARVTITSAQQPESALNFTDSFSSALPKGGTAVHTFEASRGGNSAVTLTTARVDQVLRLAVGLWDGAVCRVTVATDTAAGGEPQLVAGLDPGTYCVVLRDATSTHQTAFSITISHP